MLRGNRPNPSQNTEEKNLLKVRKSLCLNRVQKDQQLKFKKSLLQTLLKKHRQKGCPFPIDKSRLLREGVCGNKVFVLQRTLSYGAPIEFSSSASNRYHQVLLKQQRIIQEILWDIGENVPSVLFSSLGALRNLQTLQLKLITREFLRLPRVLETLRSLRNMLIIIRKSQQEETVDPKRIEAGVIQFCRQLASKKHLRNLFFKTEKKNCFSSESGEILFNTIEDLNLEFFRVTLAVDENICFNLHKIQNFLKKVENLSLSDYSVLGNNENRSLHFLSPYYPNFTDVLVECASLEWLDFDPLSFKDNLPQSLGLAKNITELRIHTFFKHNTDALPQLTPLLSEASKLVILNLDFEILAISNAPSDSKIKSELVSIISSNAPLWHSSMTFKELFLQIIKLQTLRNLSFSTNYLEEVMSFEIIFKNMANLESLLIKIRSVGSEVSDFPIESLGSMQNLEVLEADCPVFGKLDVVSRFPKLSSLKDVTISDSYGEMKLNITTYNKKFGL